jgi:hypothetical protein
MRLEHQRRKVLHFGVTEHPTAEWAAQQIVEAFAYRDATRYLIRDRDASYGSEFRRRIQSLGIGSFFSGTGKLGTLHHHVALPRKSCLLIPWGCALFRRPLWNQLQVLQG